jgi:hypothetical protein
MQFNLMDTYLKNIAYVWRFMLHNNIHYTFILIISIKLLLLVLVNQNLKGEGMWMSVCKRELNFRL